MSDLLRRSSARVSPLLSVLKQRREGGSEPEASAAPTPAGDERAQAGVPVSLDQARGVARLREMALTRIAQTVAPGSERGAGSEVAEVIGPATPAFGGHSPRLMARRAQRRRQHRGILASFIVCVAVPTLLAAFYYLFLASNQYVSEVRFAVRAVERNAGRDAANAVGGPPNALAGNTDSFIVADYVTSRQFVDEMNAKIDLRKIFAPPSADFWTRFNTAAPVEALVDHWRSLVVSHYDLSTGILSVKVRAYTPQDSQRLAQAVLDGSERLANELTNRGRQDFVRFAEAEVQKAEQRLQTARNAMSDFRRTEGTFDPVRMATSNADLGAKLRADLSNLRAEAVALSASMQPSAPLVQTLNSRIRATEEQLRRVEGEAMRNGAGADGDMSSLIARYASLDSEQGFAEKSYGMAVEALRSARGLADRQQVYLATFARPALAESSQYPNRPTSILLVAGFATLIWITGLLIVLGIRDHMR